MITNNTKKGSLEYWSKYDSVIFPFKKPEQ